MNNYRLTIDFSSDHNFGDRKPPAFKNQRELKAYLYEFLDWLDAHSERYELKDIDLAEVIRPLDIHV